MEKPGLNPGSVPELHGSQLSNADCFEWGPDAYSLNCAKPKAEILEERVQLLGLALLLNSHL